MSIAGLAIALLLTLLTLAIVAYPLLRAPSTATAQNLSRDLDAQYERVLVNIRDLDEDHATGKLDSADYHSEREVQLQRGIELLRRRDQPAGVTDA